MYSYPFPRPAVTVDIALLTRGGSTRRILLIKRLNEPFKEQWALPGGFVDEHEDLEPAAQRELAEETGITGLVLEQFHAFGAPGRDPRGHTVTIVYIAQVDGEPAGLRAGSDAKDARWFDTDQLPELAFDHDEIIARIVRHIK